MSSCGREPGVDVSGAFPLHVLVAGDRGGELSGWRVDGVEGEDVEEEETAVVEQVLDAASCQPEIGVRDQRDLLHGVDAIYVGHNALHCEVPVLVHERLVADGEDRDVPGFNGRRWGVGREELDVEGVELVDRNHAFAVVVQVFHEHLAERVEFPSACGGGVAGKELGLLFEAAHKVGELGDDGLVGVDIW